jgi:hypothetical protein
VSSEVPTSVLPLTIASTQYLAGDAWYEKFTIPTVLYGWDSSLYGLPSKPILGLPKLYEFHPDGTFINEPEGLTLWIDRSLRTMIPSIKPNLSLVNSVLELKDFKTLPETVRRVAEVLKTTKALASKKKLLRAILKGGADVYLQSQFNILPLLSDISGIQRSLRSTRDVVAKLLRQEGQPLVRHFNAQLDGVYRESDETTSERRPGSMMTNLCGQSPFPDSKFIGDVAFRRSVRYPVAKFHAQMQYSYKFSEFQRTHAELLGLLDAFGVNLNPSIIWNAIPWSFVVDWVVDVSQFLSRFGVRNLEPTTVIHKYLWSVDVRRDTQVWLTANLNTAGRLLPSEMLSASCVEKSYKRVSGIPSLITGVITTSGLSLKEMSLGTALVIGRRR